MRNSGGVGSRGTCSQGTGSQTMIHRRAAWGKGDRQPAKCSGDSPHARRIDVEGSGNREAGWD